MRLQNHQTQRPLVKRRDVMPQMLYRRQIFPPTTTRLICLSPRAINHQWPRRKLCRSISEQARVCSVSSYPTARYLQTSGRRYFVSSLRHSRRFRYLYHPLQRRHRSSQHRRRMPLGLKIYLSRARARLLAIERGRDLERIATFPKQLRHLLPDHLLNQTNQTRSLVHQLQRPCMQASQLQSHLPRLQQLTLFLREEIPSLRLHRFQLKVFSA
mmetsp:Transcript_2845/g.10146  ORF Transcript_2845/g.10146 Transcript_2845/m.10146 type:complete len:213 (+) Transcript_2845:4002-4640(+)